MILLSVREGITYLIEELEFWVDQYVISKIIGSALVCRHIGDSQRVEQARIVEPGFERRAAWRVGEVASDDHPLLLDIIALGAQPG